MQLYLVRHGTALMNQNGKYVGWLDTRLSREGKKQASCLAEHFAAARPFLLYASDLRRARDTALIMGSASSIRPRLHPELRELNFGSWEGKSMAEIMETPGQDELMQRWLKDPFRHSPPGGETLQQMKKRLLGFLQKELLSPAAAAAPRIVLVTHGGPIRLLLSFFRREEKEGFWKTAAVHGSVSILEKKKNRRWFQVVAVNETEHLLRCSSLF